MALARIGRRWLFPAFLLIPAASAFPAAAGTPGSGNAPAPAAAPSRWALPPANVAMRSAILGGTSRMEQVLVAQRSVAPRRTFGAAAATPAAAPAEPATDLPNVFGSVALAVAATPLDAQWQRASVAEPLDVWTRQVGPLPTGDRTALLRQVNGWVNDRLEFVEDAHLHDEPDRWSGAAETLRRGRGDCEDYALTKLQLLASLGVDRNDLYLVVVRDTLRQGDHAVLVVRADDRFLVLDNLTDVVVESGTRADYRPIFSYSAAGRWVHGFPVDGQSLRVASGSPRAAP